MQVGRGTKANAFFLSSRPDACHGRVLKRVEICPSFRRIIGGWAPSLRLFHHPGRPPAPGLRPRPLNQRVGLHVEYVFFYLHTSEWVASAGGIFYRLSTMRGSVLHLLHARTPANAFRSVTLNVGQFPNIISVHSFLWNSQLTPISYPSLHLPQISFALKVLTPGKGL